MDIGFLKQIDENRKQIITIVTIGAFSDFLKSDDYQRWFWTRESPVPIESPFRSVFSHFHSDEFQSMLSKDSWLQTLCHLFDNLPISISIGDATQRRFPLIYTNTRFQTMSGFAQHEVIGKSNKFLQKGMVEADMGGIMTKTLAAGERCRVFITNKRNNDTPYRSLLSMKPIHSFDGTYRFVVGVQYDVTHESSSYISFGIAQDIFEAIPSTCPNDPIGGTTRNALSPDF